jgi:phosphatidylserine decarboxylase
MLTSYGYSTMIKVVLLCMILSAAAMIFPSGAQISILLTVGIALLFTLYFFRDPNRTTPDEQRVILAPADGKIILVQPHAESTSANHQTLVSIFMSPFNVHVNRIPISGKVTHLRYCPGKFLMAFDNKSMESNERMEIGIDNGEIEVLFNQVSGFLARRIVCTLKSGEMVKIGKRFGMIKFGSRVDLILPPSAKVAVQPGQKTRAGETIIARY